MVVKQWFVDWFSRQMKEQAEQTGGVGGILHRLLKVPDVRRAETPEERQRVFEFRYRIYVEEMGKSISSANASTRTISDDLDDHAIILFIEDAGNIVATLRSYLGCVAPFPDRLLQQFDILPLLQHVPLEQIAMTSSTMMDPRWRSSTALAALSGYLYCFGRERGMTIDLLCCTPGLVRTFTRIGYRRYKDNIVVPDVGLRVPMMVQLDNMEYLKSIHSPLYPLGRQYPQLPKDHRWFERAYPNHCSFVDDQHVSAPAFWDDFTTRLIADRIQILEGLSAEESRAVATDKTVLKCGAGDALLRTGDVGNEMFVLLSGAAEVFVNVNGHRQSLAVLGPGDSFGEMALLSQEKRSADVIAIADLELLVICTTVATRKRQRGLFP
jgi:hypothetical protein